MRSWIFEAEIADLFPKKPIKIADCEIKIVETEEKDTPGFKCVASSRIKAKTRKEAMDLALEKFDGIFTALSIATGERFEYRVMEGYEVTPDGKTKEKEDMIYRILELKMKMIDFQSKLIETTNRLIELIGKTDRISQRSIDYFLIGTKLRKWPSEAFLNFFKVIELISDTFRSQLEDELLAKIGDLTSDEIKMLFTRKRVIIAACNVLGVDYDFAQIKKLVDVRNSFDVAHPSLEPRFNRKFLNPCREMARRFLIQYLERTHKN